MRKPDIEVQEVVCSETGKPMSKIPLWMAGMKVNFISDEARQKHPSPAGILDVEPIRKSLGASSDIDDVKEYGVAASSDEPDADFEEEVEAEAEEAADDDF